MSKTRIIESVKALDLPEIKRIVDAKPELLRVWDPRRRNLLHLACSVDCEELGLPERTAVKVVGYLLDKGLDIEEPGGAGPDSMPPIWFAVCRGRNKTLVKYMIDRGAKPTGLYAAGWWQDIDILKLLVKSGAELEEHGGDTPFLACWGWKRFEAAKVLAELGANVNVQDRKGRTALHIGVEKEFDPALLQWLVKHGASPDIEDREGQTARQKAARKRNKAYLEALG